MNRSPLFYPMQRGMDSDGGGAADLQTDVMRFMAILSLCLVAIFALVQSIPLVQSSPIPAPSVTQAVPPPPLDLPEVSRSVSVAPKPVAAKPVAPKTITREAPVETARPMPVVTTPAAKPIQATPAPSPLPPTPSTVVEVPADEGFTLQFETDHALTNLVAANTVGLYAITPERALRMTIENDQPTFWDASLPRQFHEMDATTVPSAVVHALQRYGNGASELKWGVTLPNAMTERLNQLLRGNAGGALVIGADGILRLEH